MESVYKIKTSLRLPMALAGLLGIPIMYDIFTRGLPAIHIILVTILMIMFYILTVNNLVRRVITSENHIDIINYLGKTSLPMHEISSVDGYTMGNRQFIIINAGKRSYFIQNSFIGFSDIIQKITTMLPADKIKDGLHDIQQTPLTRAGDTMAAWLTVIIMTAIISRTFI